MALELKTLAVDIRALLEIEKNESFHTAIMKILKSTERDKIFGHYVALTGGLENDHLQRIHQFWYADREGKKQDYTPPSLAALVAALTGKDEGEYTVYDFCAGSGAMALAHWRRNSAVNVICEELDERVIPLLLFNLAIRNISGYVINKDVLSGTIYKTYKLTRGKQYADIVEAEPPVLQKYDAVVSNPPFNLAWTPRIDERFFICEDAISKSKGNANSAFILHALHFLKDDGHAALVLPHGILTSTTQEQVIRRYLAEENKVGSVITTPPKMFESTDIPTCILMLKNKQADEKIAFINAHQIYSEEIREQRGEGDACHANRVYQKTINVFTNDHIKQITETANNPTDIEEFSAAVSTEDIRNKDYNYAPSHYIKFKAGEIQHRAYADIARDLNNITRERNKVKLTVNEGVAKQFGLFEVAELAKQSNAITDEINKTSGQLFEFHLDKNNYLTLSKAAKEFKIENKDKEELSSILLVFLPSFLAMYKQHIYYLNERENELLKELRDAMLPELMSGKIDVSQIDIKDNTPLGAA